MNTVKNAWIFDVDGVITNPQEKKVTEPAILEEIIKRLSANELVALVTGRSIDFMRERVVAPLRDRISDLSLLQNFLAVGEKGGVWITYNQDGKPQEHIDRNISVSQDLQDEVRNLINTEFSDLMFYDESKKTMISTEMKDGEDLDKYHQRQKQLSEKLEHLVREHGLGNVLEVDPTTIATDVQDKNVGKDFAARRVLSWLKEQGIKPQNFIMMGDSKSDIPMAKEVHDEGLSVTFVFVGKEDDRRYIESLHLPFPVTFTQDKYDKGTLEFLQSTA